MDFFPHDAVRAVQSELVKDIGEAIEKRKCIIAHAPTGLGKTAAALAPAIEYALRNKKKVFFLTSRHTQHTIAIDTLRAMKKKHGLKFSAVDMIGKRHMCSQPAVELLRPSEFYEYCKSLVNDGVCSYFTNSRKSEAAKQVMIDMQEESPMHAEHAKMMCASKELCTYEMTCMLAKHASAVVSDYSYIFNNHIRSAFFTKAGIELGDCIIIVDEGHNLPKRIRDQLTEALSTITLQRALSEAKKFGYGELAPMIEGIAQVVIRLAKPLGENGEALAMKDEFVKEVERIEEYDKIAATLAAAADDVREQQKSSFMGSIAGFMLAWKGGDEGFARIISNSKFKGQPVASLSYRCLDPSVESRRIISEAHSTIIMSGTLTPTSMFRDILGFENAIEKEYSSPFPKENRLNLTVPCATTRFTRRSPEEYGKIARICAAIANEVPGNSIFFMPSYRMLADIATEFSSACRKKIMVEAQDMTKEQKSALIEEFKSSKKEGAALLAVAAGSFGEGIDLPGDNLKAAIVVGIPLTRPGLETKELIRYYDEKFGKGWDYGYVLPAITISLQNAGRCIRSERDRGVRVFIDERYAWPSYKRCFPADWKVINTTEYIGKIKDFFSSP